MDDVQPIKLTLFKSLNGPLSKRLDLDDDGKLTKAGACAMTEGRAKVLVLDADAPFKNLAGLISNMESEYAMSLGAIRGVEPDTLVGVVTKARLNGQENIIARDQEHIIFEPDQPAMLLLDYDTEAMPDAVREKVEEAGGFVAALPMRTPACSSAC